MKRHKDHVVAPTSLIKKIETIREEQALEAEAERRSTEERNLKRERLLAENRRKGLRLARKIFSWAMRLKESEIGRQLMEIGNTHSFARRAVFFFDGHIPEMAWRGLGISSDGLFWHPTGCGASDHVVATPKELAEQVGFQILEEACRWIEDGRVWECIERRLERDRQATPEWKRQRIEELKKKLGENK